MTVFQLRQDNDRRRRSQANKSMSDSNIYHVQACRVNLDLVDEDWEKDCLSDDGTFSLTPLMLVLY